MVIDISTDEFALPQDWKKEEEEEAGKGTAGLK